MKVYRFEVQDLQIVSGSIENGIFRVPIARVKTSGKCKLFVESVFIKLTAITSDLINISSNNCLDDNNMCMAIPDAGAAFSAGKICDTFFSAAAYSMAIYHPVSLDNLVYANAHGILESGQMHLQMTTHTGVALSTLDKWRISFVLVDCGCNVI